MKFDRLMTQLLAIFSLVVLIGGALVVVAPFVTALIWGAILAYCTRAPFQRLVGALGGRRGWATLLMILLILVLLLGPIFYAGFTFATHIDELVAFVRERYAQGMPTLPEWLVRVPVLGPRAEQFWEGLAAQNPEVVARVREIAGTVARSGLVAAVAVMQGLGMLTLSVVFAAVFYLGGENAAAGLLAGMRRIAGVRSAELLALVGNTVKGVVFGVLGTSLVQGALVGIGYWLAGLPSPVLLAFVTAFLAVIPGGPLLVVVPGVLWLVQHGLAGWAAFLVIWALLVGIATDNVLKPILIGKTSHVPLILVMIGVLGGALTFGFLGVFIGPTLLAVARVLLGEWAHAEPLPEESPGAAVAGVRSAAR